MLIYPGQFEEKLEIDQIREIIKKYCLTEQASQKVDQVKPLTDAKKLNVFLDQTRECIAILYNEERPVASFTDFYPTLKKLKASGTFLPAEDFFLFKKGLETLYYWTQFLKKNKDEYPSLFNLTLGFIADLTIAREIESKIDENGNVRDQASKELQLIRKEINSAERKVRKAISSVLSKIKKDKFTDEDSEVTIREGRLVVPVRAEHKRQISGFIHGESATGQTVYMEPAEVLELNNQVREWYYQENREIRRILTQLADRIRDSLTDLDKGAGFMVLMDFIHAKAKFAKDYEATVPELSKTPEIRLENAYHPLLRKLGRQQGKEIIPLSLSLSHHGDRMVVISGPNAGGKSVALKTVGLLQYMMQCGFPVTCGEESRLGIFRNFFLDIGDSQSLENDLSTYSSRLRAMNYFVKFSDKKTLILMDEFGSGTEPQYGGAIAESVLERIHSSRSFGVITTHYANIKEFAEKQPGIINASMKFDAGELEPLFQLDVGKPGSSFAFEMARKNGMGDEIIEKAKKLVGMEQVTYDQLLTQLQAEKQHYEKLSRSLTQKEKELLELRRDYEQLKSMLESDKKKILSQAKEEAKRILSDANKKVENTIREIKEKKAEKEQTKRLRKQLDEYRAAFERNEEHSEKAAKGQKEKFKPGEKVSLDDSDSVGEVLSVKGRQVEVSFGQLKSFVDSSRLSRVSNKQAKKAAKKRVGGLDINDKMASFNHELDLRGRRAEEAIGLVDNYIDEALLLGMNDLKILHGKGHGILRDVIRNHLKKYSFVENIRDEHVERGGSGITLFDLKK